LLDEGRLEVRLGPGGVKPHHDAAHDVPHRVGADGGRLGTGAVVVGDVVDVTVRTVAPGVIGAANGVTLDLLAIAHDHGALAGGQVGAHVGAVGVEHDRTATFTAVQGKVAAKEGDRHRALVEFGALRHD